MSKKTRTRNSLRAPAWRIPGRRVSSPAPDRKIQMFQFGTIGSDRAPAARAKQKGALDGQRQFGVRARGASVAGDRRIESPRERPGAAGGHAVRALLTCQLLSLTHVNGLCRILRKDIPPKDQRAPEQRPPNAAAAPPRAPRSFRPLPLS